MSHQEKIKQIIQQIQQNQSGQRLVFTKKAVSHQVPKVEKNKNISLKIDVSFLNEIIKIDVKNKTCIAEPNVTFWDLVDETLKHGLVPMVVPELKGITVGGAVAGCSIESMSYKVGGFHDTCIEYEVITSDGQIIQASRTKNSEIFEMVHGTFGTVGFISQLKFKLISAQPFIRLQYYTFDSLKKYQAAIQDHFQKKDVDFIDGVIFSNKKFILSIGNFISKAPYFNSYDWNQIYWKSVEQRQEDYLTTHDYFFRYDAGCHWIDRNYGLENPIIRFLFGRYFLPSTKMLELSKKITPLLKNTKPDVVIDIFSPISRLTKFWKFYLRKFKYFPVWVVPYYIEKPYPWINSKHLRKIKDQLYIDLAIYGMKQTDHQNYYRLLEKKLLKLPGLKTLISHNYFTQKEFWKIWNQKNWLSAKQKTDPNNLFGDLYQKMNR